MEPNVIKKKKIKKKKAFYEDEVNSLEKFKDLIKKLGAAKNEASAILAGDLKSVKKRKIDDVLLLIKNMREISDTRSIIDKPRIDRSEDANYDDNLHRFVRDLYLDTLASINLSLNFLDAKTDNALVMRDGSAPDFLDQNDKEKWLNFQEKLKKLLPGEKGTNDYIEEIDVVMGEVKEFRNHIRDKYLSKSQYPLFYHQDLKEQFLDNRQAIDETCCAIEEILLPLKGQEELKDIAKDQLNELEKQLKDLISEITELQKTLSQGTFGWLRAKVLSFVVSTPEQEKIDVLRSLLDRVNDTKLLLDTDTNKIDFKKVFDEIEAIGDGIKNISGREEAPKEENDPEAKVSSTGM